MDGLEGQIFQNESRIFFDKFYMRLEGKRAVFRQILAGAPLEAQICHLEPRTGHFEADHFEAKTGHFEAKTGRFKAKTDQFEGKTGHFEAKTDHFEATLGGLPQRHVRGGNLRACHKP